MDSSYQPLPDVHVIPSHLEVPGVGVILVNAFVLLSERPVLIDTGLGVDSEQFMATLESIVDPAELGWIWLTHDDTDHTGSLGAVLERAPQAKLATHGLGALRASTWCPIPLDRVHALQIGSTIDVGDRTLHAFRPPVYDNPTSTGIHTPARGPSSSSTPSGRSSPGWWRTPPISPSRSSWAASRRGRPSTLPGRISSTEGASARCSTTCASWGRTTCCRPTCRPRP